MNPPLLAPISIGTAPHYVWGTTCDGWHLVRSPDLSVIQERMPPGTTEVRHQHRRARQFFFVLRGQLTIECGGIPHVLGPSLGLEVPPLTAHRVFNASSEPTEFLVVSQPPGHGDREPAPII
jgi:mannose-6-phosphate isomerase-like protein (cupin superfamily)